MSDQVVIVAPDSTGKKIDATELTVGPNTVERQRVQLAGAAAAQLADVQNSAPAGTEQGLVTRNIPSGTQTISGAVTAAALTDRSQKARATDGTVDVTSLYDLNTSGANEYVEGVSLRKSTVGGSVELGTATDPIRTDPTGGTAQPVTNGGTFATQDSEKLADNAGFADGTTKVQPAGFILDETAGTALTENDVAAARIDSKRALVLVVEDATTRGRRAVVSAAGQISVDASGVAVPVTDNAGSLTVDAPVGTPAFVRLSDGAAAVSTPSSRLAVEDVGNVAHDGVDSGNPVKVGGKATGNSSIPTAVSAADRVDAWMDQQGAAMIRAGVRKTYVATYRATTRPYALSKTFTANTAVQFATIYHAASATKTVRIKQVKVWLKNSTVAAVLLAELRRLSATTAPATGNPDITALPHDPGAAAAEATCKALPTTAGSEANANAGWGSQEISLGVTGAASTINPPDTLDQKVITLWDSTGMGEIEDLIIRAGQAEGYAVILDSSANTALTCTVQIVFTEE